MLKTYADFVKAAEALGNATIMDAQQKGRELLAVTTALLSEMITQIDSNRHDLTEFQEAITEAELARAAAPVAITVAGAAYLAGSADVAGPHAGVTTEQAFDQGKAAQLDNQPLNTCPYVGAIGATHENELRRAWFAGWHGEDKPAALALAARA